MPGDARTLLAECRRAYEVAAGESDALWAESAQLMGVLADPAHWSAAEVAALRLRNIQCFLDETGEMQAELATLGELLELADDDVALAVECRAGLEALAARIDAVDGRAPSRYAEREAILTIEAGPGEAGDRAATLWRTYVERAGRNGWSADTYRWSGDGLGLRAATMRIGGPGAFGWLTGEQSAHRLDQAASGVRVEAFPVAVSFDAVRIQPEETQVDEFVQTWGCGVPYPDWNRSVRLTHLPTGTTVFCEGRGSTYRNKTAAMTVLRARLLRLRGAASPAGAGESLPGPGVDHFPPTRPTPSHPDRR